MTSGRTERTEYQLRDLPHQDYCRQLQGQSISRRALLATTIEEATHESIAGTFEEREATQGETNMTTGLDQLAALMAQIVQCQEERQQREEEYHQEQDRREEERQQRDEEYCQEQERRQEEHQQRDKEHCRQQDAKHQKQLRAMQE